MKRTLLFALALTMCTLSFAQKVTRFQDTQARLLDVNPNAYVKPLTVELKVSGSRINKTYQLSKQLVEDDMRGDLANIRSYIVYLASVDNNCDVIVAATFNVHTNAKGDGYEVNIIGYPANFANWSTATTSDLEWIRMEKVVDKSDAEKTKATRK